MQIFGKDSSPIVRIFGKGKCKLIANFNARIVTSLPSVSLSVSLCLSLYLTQAHLTHNIGSASALPIIKKIEGSEKHRQEAEWHRHG